MTEYIEELKKILEESEPEESLMYCDYQEVTDQYKKLWNTINAVVVRI